MKTKKLFFLMITALCLALVVFAGASAKGVISRANPAPAAALPGDPMPALPEAACTLAGSTRTCHLWALNGSLTLPDGRVVTVWGFASSAGGPAIVPGPVIRANAGETLEIVLHNELGGQTVSLAFPGIEGIIPDLDGVATGATRTYTFPVPASGSFLYEAGLTAGGARQVAMGLFGPLVVNEAGAAWDQDEILVFSEIDPDFNANPTGFSMLQFKPHYWLINGKAFPQTGWIGVDAGTTLLLRYLNAGVGHHSISLLGIDQYIRSLDGVALPFPRGVVAETLAPGASMEALVDIPAGAAPETAYALYDASLLQHNNNQRLADMRTAFGGMLVFLQVGGTPPPQDTTGPLVSGVSVSPALTNGSVDVALAATADDSTTGGSNIATGQYRIGAGAWQAMSVSPANATVANLSATIPAATVAALADGQHTVEVQAQDTAGNWSTAGSTTLTVDKTGATISAVAAAPNPADGTAPVTLTATATDTSSNIVAAEWFVDTDPGVGSGTAMVAADGAFGSLTEGLTATIDVSAWTAGNYTLSVRAKDAAGNWSATGQVVLQKTTTGPSNVIFSDGFESGSFSAWSSKVDAENDLSVTTAAALQGSYGMAALIDNTTLMYIQDNTPVAEKAYNARFYFNPNSVTFLTASSNRIFVARNNTVDILRLDMRIAGGVYQLRASVRLDSGAYSNTIYYNMTNAPQAIELAWKASSAPGANNGVLELYIDGVLKQTLTGLDNDTLAIELARLGMLAGNLSGTEYFDAFVSTRGTYIGP